MTKKLEEIKISDDVFLGNDLSYEGKFLNSVIEKMLKEIKDCEVFLLAQKIYEYLLRNHNYDSCYCQKVIKIGGSIDG